MRCAGILIPTPEALHLQHGTQHTKPETRNLEHETISTKQLTVFATSLPPLSSEFGTNATVKTRFWPWFEPFSRQTSLKRCKLCPLRKLAGHGSAHHITRCLESATRNTTYQTRDPKSGRRNHLDRTTYNVSIFAGWRGTGPHTTSSRPRPTSLSLEASSRREPSGNL